MQQILLSLMPGIVVKLGYEGTGLWWHVLLLSALCCLFDDWGQKWRGVQPIGDGSALVTAWLLALCLPPDMRLLPLIFSAAVAILVTKQAFGGLGQNVFNPALVAYLSLLVGIPASQQWPILSAHWHIPADSWQSLKQICYLAPFDSLSSPTPLDHWQHQVSIEPRMWITPWQWQQNLAFCLGGVYLMLKRIADWRLGLVAAGAFFLASGCQFDVMCTGSTMLSIGYFVTCPVTAPFLPRARWFYAIFCGALAALIRMHSHYADGWAFAVVLANCLTPWFDRWSQRK